MSRANYKVAKGKKNRAICGLSMGGGHSFATSKRYPDMFDYVGLFSAGLHISGDRNKSFYQLLGENTEVQQQLKKLFKASPLSTGLPSERQTSSTSRMPTSAVISTRKATPMSMWRPKAATSGATGASTSLSLHR